MSKRKSHPPATAKSGYQQWISEADEIIAKHVVSAANPKSAETSGEQSESIRSDNWKQLALDWFAPDEPDRSALARYITTHENRLGVAWAREIMRMQIFLEAQDYLAVVEHYDGAFRSYPRCALVEVWVAGHILRNIGDFWRAREMCANAAVELPNHAKPFYELGFMNYLLGDFVGALEQYDRAAILVAADDVEGGARIFYNRGLVRFALRYDKQDAIADVEEALRRKPDYPQAKESLRALKDKARWVPW